MGGQRRLVETSEGDDEVVDGHLARVGECRERGVQVVAVETGHGMSVRVAEGGSSRASCAPVTTRPERFRAG
jgi:hypothetical protein